MQSSGTAHWLIYAQVEGPAPSKKLTLKEAAKAAKKLSSKKNQQDPRQEGAGTWSRRKRGCRLETTPAEMWRPSGCGSRWRARSEGAKQRSSARPSVSRTKSAELEEKEAAAKREALRLEKLGEKQKAAEVREQYRRGALEKARLKREAAAANSP